MMCRYCGSQLPDGALFCGECGRAVYVDEERVTTASSSVIVPAARSVRGLSTGQTVMPAETMVPAEAIPAAVLDDDGDDDDEWDDEDEIDAAAPAGFSIADLAFSSPGDESSPDDAVQRDLPDDASAEPAPDVARCPQCGEPMSEGDVFCGECGFVLRTVAPPAASHEHASEEGVLLPDLIQVGAMPAEAEADAAVAVEQDAPDADLTSEIEPLPEIAAVESEVPEVEAPEAAADELEAETPAEPELPAEPLAPAEPELPAEQPIDDLVREPAASHAAPAPEADPDLEFDEPLPFALPKSKPTPITRARPIPDPFPWGTDTRQPALREDIEATRLVADTASGARYVLQFSTGESVTVLGSGLVGRNPSMQPGEYVDQLVPIFDAGKSVSKTHLEFGQEAGRFWVSDRYSTNGSVIRQPDAEPRRCDPGRRYFIGRGTRVDVGEQFFVVS